MTRGAWVVMALACACGACDRAEPEQTVTEAPVPVVVAPATRGNLREVISASGTVTPAPGAELTVTAPEAARIADLPRAEGDLVRKGDLLVRFDIPALSAGAAAGQASIDQAEARVENATAAAARVTGLFERGVAARKEVEDAERELREARAALAQARSASGAAVALAGRTVVRARFNGVVAKRWHNPGDLVEPGPGDPILRVIDPSDLEITAAVPVAALPRIQPGGPARVLAPGADVPIDAAVVARPASVEPGSVTASVRLRLKGGARLTNGLVVNVEILGPEQKDVVIVPAAAVTRDADTARVMTVSADGVAHDRVVELGVATPDAVEIRKGVAAGERVVVRGQNGLPDGTHVSVGK